MKYSFKNDYSEGCHPKIIESLRPENFIQQNGYGEDEFCIQAENLIIEKCKSPHSRVFFVTGGTFANLLVISALLKSYESVISADTGHINSNETGAIENAGYKIHNILTENGKLSPELILPVLETHTNFPHQVKPKLVYISNSTELGTIYSKKEIEALSEFCKEKNLLFFMDGARIGHAVTAEDSDVSLEDIAKLTDVFYIGGTKNGAMFGESVVVNNPGILDDIRFHMKQKGGLLAKGRFLGIQFKTLFENDLYFDLAKNANIQAQKLKQSFIENHFKLLSDTTTNQIFPILENSQIEELYKNFDFYIWKKIDDHLSAIRIVTSWATEDKVIESFIAEIKKL